MLEKIRKKHPVWLKRNSIDLDGGWAYKWLKRFDNAGLEGLKNRHRSGRPPEVSEETSAMILKELSENQSGWMAKEVMNLIYERTGVKYHEVHIYRLLQTIIIKHHSVQNTL